MTQPLQSPVGAFFSPFYLNFCRGAAVPEV